MAASGGYITALAADHIVAQQTSLVGSIGVLFQFPNVADLLDKIGVKVESVKSTPLKAAPDGYEPTSPEARAALESIIKDSYAWFRGIVQDRRHLTDAELQTVADGRVFTGHQGIDNKLIDELGDERTAIAWLAKEKNVDAKLPVRDYRLRSRFERPAIPACGRGGAARCGGAQRPGAAARRTGARLRPSTVSILTVYWPFGTLRARTERRSLGQRTAVSTPMTGAAFAGYP